MSDLYCPTCQWKDSDATRDDGSSCPHCGSGLRASGNPAETQPNLAEDDALVAQLREAFGSGSRGVGGRIQRSGGASGKRGAASAAAAEALPPGSRLADFEILDEIGRGGMGVVYRARQISLDRPVALKVMTGARRIGPTASERFHREARAAGRLNHANVVPVYAQGSQDDTHFYAMKLIEGVSLDTAIQSRPELLSSTHHLSASSKRAVERLGPLPIPYPSRSATPIPQTPPPNETPPQNHAHVRRNGSDYRYMASLLAGAADGLAHAHLNGVVHRDIKPHNLILGDDLQLHLTDFGLAFLALESHITLSGEVMGTPAYLSPEQVRGDISAIDHRTDIYSLGVTLYEMITGHRPFEFETRDQVLHAVGAVEPRRPRQWETSIPKDMETICLRAIEKEPSRRYATANDLAEDLRRFAEGRPILTRRAGTVERSVKWARRHRSLTAAMVAIAAVFFAGTGWSMSVTAGNRREAVAQRRHIEAQQREGDALLQSAYERLVHQDYLEFEDVVPQIDAAEKLGVDAAMLQIVRTLVDIGKSDNPAAIARMKGVVAVVPEQRDWHYLLAWAMYRDRQRDAAVQLIKDVDAAGGPQTAEGWFFRAMAVNHYDAEEAIRSHRQAIALRADKRDFFPLAGLNLARAFNQLMYSQRTTDGFTESTPILLRLEKDGYYGARPHYLLSIAHRLAGEILRDSRGARAGASEEHFEEALEWAQKGIEKDPTSNHAVTARAECLEQLGRLDEAVAARTDALELATTQNARCESLHYRWRLYYWLNDFDHALTDIAARSECVQDAWYKHVYRALIHADQGNLDAARREALAIFMDAPESPDAVLLSGALRFALGDQTALGDVRTGSETIDWSNPAWDATTVPGWKQALVAFVLGESTFDALTDLAVPAEKPYRLTAEAEFLAGLLALGHRNRDAATTHFTNSHQSFDSEAAFSYHARVLLQKLRTDPSWPVWLAPSDSVGSSLGNGFSTSALSGKVGHE